MKKVLSAFVGIVLISLVSCGGKNNNSSAFNKTKRILDSVTEKLVVTNDCELVQELSVTAMLCTDDLDAFTPNEKEEILKLKNKFVEAYNQKRNVLNCLGKHDTEENPDDEVDVVVETDQLPSGELFGYEDEFED